MDVTRRMMAVFFEIRCSFVGRSPGFFSDEPDFISGNSVTRKKQIGGWSEELNRGPNTFFANRIIGFGKCYVLVSNANCVRHHRT